MPANEQRDDLENRRAALAERLRAWEAEDGEPIVTGKTTAQILEEADRQKHAEQQREIEDRIAAEVEQRLAQIEENTRPKAPPIYRRDLSASEKSKLMAKMGDRYLDLPFAPPGERSRSRRSF